MILIFSQSFDPSTLDVLRWIDHLSAARVVRINADEAHDVELAFRDDDYHVRVDGDSFWLSEVSSAWLRKGDFWFKGLFPEVEGGPSRAFDACVTRRLQQESVRLRGHFHHVLRRRCTVLGSAHGSTPNKLTTLEIARELGLRTPPFALATTRADVERMLGTESSWVTKAMSDGLYLFDVEESKAGYFTYTELVHERSLDELGDRLVPSFLQSYVEKAFEVRVFFLEDWLTSVAIFSQNDEKTRVDYRKYNHDKPNRVVPYALPGDVHERLLALARRLDLNTGSIDLVVDPRGEHYFLEVNPVGQFGALSQACNLGIERRIAERLLSDEG